MKFGCCAAIEQYDEVVNAGYDFIEVPGWELASLSDEELEKAKEKFSAGPIPCQAVNAYAKDRPKMVGEGFDEEDIRQYAELIMSRASFLGAKTVGIGAPGIRKLPENYDKNTVWQQAKRFLTITSEVAEKYNIIVLFESVHKFLCQFATTLDDVYDMVKELNLPNLKMVVDYYHLKVMDEDIYDIGKYIDCTVHLHTSGLAENYSRPQLTEEYYDEHVRIFKNIKELGYDRTFSNESETSNIETAGKAALEIIKRAYENA